ncbi:MAG: S41 family peptidase [Elusimicrobia bacterium]|jgi:carboxyl-terminal processing protease|nr:S41 family peptidase [Elusimicrobiota bacterium]
MKNLRKLALVTLSALVIGAVFPYVNFALDNTYQQLKVIVDVLELIKDSYVEQIDPQKLVYGAARGMVEELDDFSQFMEPDVYDRVKSDTEGEFGGIGIRVDSKDGWLTVVTPLPNTPAFRAQMMPGDKIIKIEGVTTKDLIIDEAIKKLRGKPGTQVKITTAREPEEKGAEWITKDITLTRELIKAENVKWRMLDNKTGYIKIVEFTGHCTENFSKAIAELKGKGMESLVLDLRYNPGGLLSAAVDISKMFMNDNKMIVFTKGRKPENYQEFRANGTAAYETLPMVILVNRYSASASEIVAGAMQDNKRAVIIGERSFGKASVQSMIPLSDKSALRLTIAKYYTPSGKSIQHDEKNEHGGISPDIEVKVPVETEKKLIQQADEIYFPGKDDKDGKKKDLVRDEVVERAMELLKAREVLGNLKPGK